MYIPVLYQYNLVTVPYNGEDTLMNLTIDADIGPKLVQNLPHVGSNKCPDTLHMKITED